MNRIAMSAAASGVLRALIARARVPRDRILLTKVRSGLIPFRHVWCSYPWLGVLLSRNRLHNCCGVRQE